MLSENKFHKIIHISSEIRNNNKKVFSLFNISKNVLTIETFALVSI